MAEYNDTIEAKAGVDLSGATSITAPTTGGVPQVVQVYTRTIDFSDLGSGASDTIALTGFPTNVVRLGAAVEINTKFAGEADLAMKVGDTGNDDELIANFTIHDLSVGWADTTAGSDPVGFEADYATDGADATFTATELDDVSAGNCTIHVFYIAPALLT